jgi:hypothetical protein
MFWRCIRERSGDAAASVAVTRNPLVSVTGIEQNLEEIAHDAESYRAWSGCHPKWRPVSLESITTQPAS